MFLTMYISIQNILGTKLGYTVLSRDTRACSHPCKSLAWGFQKRNLRYTPQLEIHGHVLALVTLGLETLSLNRGDTLPQFEIHCRVPTSVFLCLSVYLAKIRDTRSQSKKNGCVHGRVVHYFLICHTILPILTQLSCATNGKLEEDYPQGKEVEGRVILGYTSPMLTATLEPQPLPQYFSELFHQEWYTRLNQLEFGETQTIN